MRSENAVSVITLYLILYVVLIQFGAPYPLITAVFTLSPFLIIWMVFRVLRDPVSTSRTFDDYFYQDADIARVKEFPSDPDN